MLGDAVLQGSPGVRGTNPRILGADKAKPTGGDVLDALGRTIAPRNDEIALTVY